MNPETPKQEKYRPTREEIIEGKFGKEYIEKAEQISRTVFEQIKSGLANIGLEEGTSQEQREKAQQFLEMWNQFANGLFVRTLDADKKSPEEIKTAIEAANSLFSPEPTNEGEKAAKKMIEELEKRFGKLRS
ncbi:hypothetical protein A2242_00145 [Candidatus Falkowbacteria bacterium RIFOXYA2_FULL_47_9]|uniref:Uncharacterized protein n=1 Tax=Candidatus Falkowbacteria bacterium RIFOXYA2_FULL_47_9 TaxID=1797995 RepID=A0A1F5SJA7_9BACT|nr:MAG: hypothetical protein A2242_00145 [Candidatus Falkowbacteria bacterium RIFOXYA2_FULL_47_9]